MSAKVFEGVRSIHVAVALAIVMVMVVATPAEAGPFRAVYTQTQDPGGNEVVVFDRAGNGRLTEVARVPTGGLGAASTPPFGFPILDSQGGVEMTQDGTLLFVVNAGSDSVSSFRITPAGLVLADVEGTGGALPISVDSHSGLLYVLNLVSGTISGFTYDAAGDMTALPGSIESLATPGPDGAAAQVGFDQNGRTLTVTERATGLINRFAVKLDGTTGRAVATPSAGETPFGFASSGNDLFVSNAGHVGDPPDPGDPTQFNGSTTAYDVHRVSMTEINTEPAERANCWVTITSDGEYAFASNTLSNTISRYHIGPQGVLTLLGHTPTSEPSLFEGGALATDMALSNDDKYLYVLSAIGGDGTGTIDVFRRNGGDLNLVQTLDGILPAGASGLAAR